MNIWLLIALMAVVTYLPRYLPMALAGRVRLPPPVEQALDFVPIAVLTAIIAKAALAALAAALLWRRLFVTIAVGLACYAGLKLLL